MWILIVLAVIAGIALLTALAWFFGNNRPDSGGGSGWGGGGGGMNMRM